MGAAGDMLTAALLELCDNKEEMIQKLNDLKLPKVTYVAEKMEKCGIMATHMKVMADGREEESHDIQNHNHVHLHEHYIENAVKQHEKHEHTHTHHHSSLSDIKHIVSHLELPEKVKADIMNVYQIIAEAESHVHGTKIEEIHFHEVGTIDAIADVTAVCILMNELQPERVVASEIHVGSGQVKCAHGILPVPAPATAYILQGIPTYGGSISGELCTPTGAALLKYFVDEYGAQPAMATERIGYGCGKKDFAQANIVRVFLGNTGKNSDDVVELSCNLDDMTAEEIGYAMEVLLKAGALDVYTVPIGMKKNRPAAMLCCLCKEQQKKEIITIIFKHTATIGIREYLCHRYTLDRNITEINTPYGIVRKKSVSGWGVSRYKYEYDDLTAIAEKHNMSLAQVKEVIKIKNI